jgi:hypothetical protein
LACFYKRKSAPEEIKNAAMNKPTRKHTGRHVSRRHAGRNSTSRKSKLGNDDFYKLAVEADRILELEFADEDPEGIRLGHK